MEIVELDEIKSCIQTGIAHMVGFDSLITPEFIHFWKEYGRVDYYSDFPRPFFRIVVKDQFQIDGVEFNSSIRLTIISKEQQSAIDHFIKVTSRFRG